MIRAKIYVYTTMGMAKQDSKKRKMALARKGEPMPMQLRALRRQTLSESAWRRSVLGQVPKCPRLSPGARLASPATVWQLIGVM